MIIIGVDPGTALLGYGIIESGDQPVMIASGAVSTAPDENMPGRLLRLYDAMTTLIAVHEPDVVAIEQLFFARNVTTAIAVGQARGVALLAAARAGITVAEYTPSEVKHAIAGYGKATKQQMQEMVRLILALDTAPRPDDAADALAVALCHAQTAPFLDRVRPQSR